MMRREVRLQCRWCKRPLPPKWRDAHELVCFHETKQAVDAELLKAAQRVEELRTAEWYRTRWRALPGKGWSALAGSAQLLEVMS